MRCMGERCFWKIEFTAHMDDFETDSPILSGEVGAYAKDIFEALEIGKAKIESFGYDHYVITSAHDE